jgi:hypothetical protein
MSYDLKNTDASNNYRKLELDLFNYYNERVEVPSLQRNISDLSKSECLNLLYRIKTIYVKAYNDLVYKRNGQFISDSDFNHLTGYLTYLSSNDERGLLLRLFDFFVFDN